MNHVIRRVLFDTLDNYWSKGAEKAKCFAFLGNSGVRIELEKDPALPRIDFSTSLIKIRGINEGNQAL